MSFSHKVRGKVIAKNQHEVRIEIPNGQIIRWEKNDFTDCFPVGDEIDLVLSKEQKENEKPYETSDELAKKIVNQLIS